MYVIAKSLDVVVLLKLLLERQKRPYAQVAKELAISASEVHESVQRGILAGLIDPLTRIPLRKPLEDYLLYGVMLFCHYNQYGAASASNFISLKS